MKHNIVCIETEWYVNDNKKQNRFNLKSEHLLNTLRDMYKCEVIRVQALSPDTLQFFLDQFKKREYNKFDIFYFAFHGWNHQIMTEAYDKEGQNSIDLQLLAEMAGNLFENKIVHFSSCRTMANEGAALQFKNVTKARLVSGYASSVDAMKSLIADMALMNEIMCRDGQIGNIANPNHCRFRQTYKSLLDELKFRAV